MYQYFIKNYDLGGVLGMGEGILSESKLQEIRELLEQIRMDLRERLFSYNNLDFAEDALLEDLEYDIDDKIDDIEKLIPNNDEINFVYLNQNFIIKKLKRILVIIREQGVLKVTKEAVTSFLYETYYALDDLELFIDSRQNIAEINKLLGSAKDNEYRIKKEYESANTLVNYLRHAQGHNIYVGESEKFKKLAFKYELSFYFLLVSMFIYFSGLTIYIPDFQFFGVNFGFPERNISNGNISFYIQKISVLVLTSTLAAFLLKRSFVNRDLFQEAYRVAQELNALPPYIQSFSQEVQDKIRLDLAYKYFGREHNSDKGSENFMAENIKANTEFLKVVKDLSSGKADKALLEKTEQDKV
ncbi:hypothetical protein [Acinetobacter johnsonii]|uniref:hypothetical protein n=1 Tax=Acinetobacter johnsonii TaxID=40214 RepID=UPI00216A3BCC|nr:hypothetical protein [Acinetobacter johnsonii]MCS3527850.1 hypothetical protein [Acinetobacter johnsonii]